MLRRLVSGLALVLRGRRPPAEKPCPAAYAIRGKNYRLVHCVLEHGHEPPCEDERGGWRKDLLK